MSSCAIDIVDMIQQIMRVRIAKTFRLRRVYVTIGLSESRDGGSVVRNDLIALIASWAARTRPSAWVLPLLFPWRCVAASA